MTLGSDSPSAGDEPGDSELDKELQLGAAPNQTEVLAREEPFVPVLFQPEDLVLHASDLAESSPSETEVG